MMPLVVKKSDYPFFEVIEVVEEEQDEVPWYTNVWNYMEKCKYPERASKKDKKAIRRFSSQFII